MAADEFELPIIDVPEDAASPETIVRFLAKELVRLGGLPHQHVDSVVSAVLRRELLGSTGIGRGLAFPHVASELIDTVLGIIGRLPKSVIWPGVIDNQPVDSVWLLITPKSNSHSALQAMEAVARQLRKSYGL